MIALRARHYVLPDRARVIASVTRAREAFDNYYSKFITM